MKITNLPAHLIDQVRQKNPVVLTVANDVTAGKVADALSACGVSPIMSKAPEEAQAMVSLADAITINLGTINQSQLALIRAILMPTRVGVQSSLIRSLLAVLTTG
ncbi:MAG: hydroxyethylthiazole kinase [Limosilactobacillus pontis]